MTEQHHDPEQWHDSSLDEAPTPPQASNPAISQPPGVPAAPVPAPAAPEPVREPVTEWNPLASLDTVTLPVPSSNGAATLLVKPWSGRERLTYSDQLLSRFLTPAAAEEGQAPDDVPDVIKLATMRLVSASLTLQGSTGFPARSDDTSMFSGADKRRVEQELLALAPKVYDEVLKLCTDFEPLPRAQVDEDRPGDGKAAGDDDPFPTPSTPPTAAP